MSNPLKESSEKLPSSDARDAAVKSLEDKCRACVELAHRVASAYDKMSSLRTEMEAAIYEAAGKPCEKISSAIEVFSAASVLFGNLEADLYNLKDEIEADLKVYNRDHRLGIYVSHTAEGLPIRVSKSMKRTLWGS